MSDLTELWELPDDMSPADRLSVESILRHAGGKKIVLRRFWWCEQDYAESDMTPCTPTYPGVVPGMHDDCGWRWMTEVEVSDE